MKRIWFLLKQNIKTALRFIFSFVSGGENCIICGNTTYIYPVCKNCFNERFSTKQLLTQPRCEICGKTLISTKNICFQCRENRVINNVELMLPLFSYRLWNKQMMFLWKAQEIRCVSNMFAKILNDVLKQLSIKYIVPVPPRPGKIKKKGWDQIDELCNLLEYKYGYTILRLLERRTTKQQKKLNRKGRLEQIGRAYFPLPQENINKICKNEIPDTVCLIDDVCTTGATIESCAQALKEVGIKKIQGITLFIVD